MFWTQVVLWVLVATVFHYGRRIVKILTGIRDSVDSGMNGAIGASGIAYIGPDDGVGE